MNTEAISQSQKFPISGYLKLTKPSIIYLLVLTAATAMFLADGFSGDLSKVIFGLFGIALIASSSAVINQILDVEIDSKMARTKNRPLVKGEISGTNAKVFSGVLLVSINRFAWNISGFYCSRAWGLDETSRRRIGLPRLAGLLWFCHLAYVRNRNIFSQ